MDKGKNKAGMSEGSSSSSSSGSEINIDFQKNKKLRILLYDADVESSKQCSTILRQCSSNYQVKAVFCASEVMNALNSSCTSTGFETDIILAEASLLVPDTGGSHLLRYITQSNYLKHIPVIMMFEEDDVSMIFKGLGLGATDYIMKPLGAADAFNLWTRVHKRNYIGQIH